MIDNFNPKDCRLNFIELKWRPKPINYPADSKNGYYCPYFYRNDTCEGCRNHKKHRETNKP